MAESRYRVELTDSFLERLASIEAFLSGADALSFGQAWEALARQARASGAAGMTDQEIQAEIDAARQERSHAPRGD